MSRRKCVSISFCMISIPILMIILVLLPPLLHGQSMEILKSNNMAGVIYVGGNNLKVGDFVVVRRMQNGYWQDVTYAEVTRIKNNYARIQVIDNGPQVPLRKGDLAVMMGDINELTGGFASNGKGIDSSNYRKSHDEFKLIYLGPSVVFFSPLGDMKEFYETQLGYGGIFGVRFRPELDVSLRFSYIVKNGEWSIWNIQLLARRYYSNVLLFDFGYGILYPQGCGVGGSNFGGSIRLGFLGGLGVSFPVAFKTRFEIGGLFHYYPDFGNGSGTFLTFQGRLVL